MLVHREAGLEVACPCPLGEHTICKQIIVCYDYTRELV